MDSLEIKSVVSGILFGIWPLIMNRSGLGGNVATFVFAAVVLLCVVPFSAGSLNQIASSHWVLAILAGVIGATGLLLFNNGLAKAPSSSVGTFIVLMIIVQVVVPAVYHAFMSGGLPASKIIGFVLAIIASVLLVK